MKYLLTIGPTRVILQNDTGLASILKALSSARIVERDLRYSGKGIRLTGEVLQITAEALPGFELVKREPVLDPEVLPPFRDFLSSGSKTRGVMGGARKVMQITSGAHP